MAAATIEVKFSMPREVHARILETAKALLADDVPQADVRRYVRDEIAQCITFTPPLRKRER